MRWAPVRVTVGILIFALACGDDDRVSGGADGGGTDMPADLVTDIPPRRDSGMGMDLGGDADLPDLGGDADLPDMGVPDLGGDGDFPEMGVPDLGGDGDFPEMGIPDLGGDGDFSEMGIPDLGGDGDFSEMGIPDLGGDGGLMEMGIPDLGGDGGIAEMGLPDLGGDGGGSDMTAADLGPGACSATVPCGSSEWCDFPAADPCGVAGGTGTCRLRPGICPLIFDPHCGCDDVTYGNACEANAAGQDTSMRGACP